MKAKQHDPFPETWGTLPELPAGGPRPLTEEDLKGFTAEQWAEIVNTEEAKTPNDQISGD